MNCKFCNAELAADVTVCPQCGKENMEEIPAGEVSVEETPIEETPIEETPVEETPVEETPAEETPVVAAPKKPSIWVTILAIIGGLAIAAVLIGAVLVGSKNSGKTVSYTVTAEKAEKARDTVVATVGERELTNSELQIYYWQGIDDFYKYYSNYTDLTAIGLDLSQPLDQQFYDESNGITWQQYFLENALNTWHRYAAVGEQAKAAGVTLDEEDNAYLETVTENLEGIAAAYGYENASAMLYQDMGPACDVDGYLRYISLNYYVGQYFDSIYESLVPTMEELQTYYAENQESLEASGIVNDGSRYVDVRHILFKPQGGTVNEETGIISYSEAEWEACRQKAQDLLDQWLAGDATEENFAQLAMTYTEDLGSQSTGGLYTDVYEGKMVEAFNDWCFDESRVYGDYDLVQTQYGYHIMYFVDSREIWASKLESQLVSQRSNAMVEKAIAEYALNANMKKVVLSSAQDTE